MREQRSLPQKLTREDQEILVRRAYETWLHFYPFEHADIRIHEVLNLRNTRWLVYGKSMPWLRITRESLFLTLEKVAEKMGISASAYAKLEQNEAQGTISIGKLSEAAEALNCELILAFRPINGITFSKQVWNSGLEEVLCKYDIQGKHGQKGPVVLARMVRSQMLNLKSRKRRGWNQRTMNLDFQSRNEL